MNETVWHVIALVASITGATWVLRGQLAKMERELASHIAYTKTEIKRLSDYQDELKRTLRDQ